MRLGTKIFLATASVATIATVSVAGLTFSVDYASSRSSIVNSLKRDFAQIDVASVDALDQALTVNEYSSVPVSVFYVDSNDKISQLDAQAGTLTRGTTKKVLMTGLKAPAQVGSLVAITKPLASGGYLTLAASTRALDDRMRQSAVTLAAGYLASLALIVLLSWLLLRRDLASLRRLRKAASKIAAGNFKVKLPTARGSRELMELTTALKQMTSSLTKALKTEKEAKRNIETFISDASHELRTPLTVIRGYGELIQANPKVSAEIAEKLITQVDRMNDLVTDLLFLAQLRESSSAKLEPVALDEIALQSCEQLAVLDPERQVGIEIDPVIVVSDRALLERFCANAISNIHRYAPQSAGARISVTSKNMQALIKIEDAGPGLSPKAYAEGIKSFQRFDESRSRSAGGSGLGMSIMRNIAEKLGGQVALSKSELGGLCVSLSLPLNDAR